MFLKKISLSILLLLIINSKINAQDVSFKWAQLQDVKHEGLIDPKIVLASENGFYTYSNQSKSIFTYDFYISKFDENAAFLKTQKINLPQRLKNEAIIKNVFESKDNKSLFLISELISNKENLNLLYIQKYNTTSEKLEAEIELNKIVFEKLSNSGSALICQSEDNSKFAAITYYPQIKDSNEKIKAIVYDEQFKKLWEKEYSLNHPSEKGYNEQLFITNEGEIILVKIIDEYKKDPKIFVFKINESEIKEIKISELEFYPLAYKIIQDKKKEIYISGYFTDNWKPTISVGGRKAKGVFTFNISQPKLTHKSNWDEKIKNDFINLSLLDLTFINNELHLIGDVNSKKEVKSTTTSFESNFIYNSGPGVISKIDSNNKLVTSIFDYDEMIFNNRNGNVISFKPIQFKNELFLLGNDSEAILKGKKLVVGNQIYSKTVVFNKFDSKTNIIANPLWESGVGGKQNVTILAPTYTKKINDSKYYVYSLGNEYQCFGVMNIK